MLRNGSAAYISLNGSIPIWINAVSFVNIDSIAPGKISTLATMASVMMKALIAESLNASLILP